MRRSDAPAALSVGAFALKLVKYDFAQTKVVWRHLNVFILLDVLESLLDTVATHRRNICAKLNIHSASGMTLFAIIHGIITLEEASDLLPGL